MPPLVIDAMREFRAGLLAEEGAQMREMARRWLLVEQRLAQDIEGVLTEIRRREATGEVFGRDRGPYTRLNRYRALLAQTREEIGAYSRWVEQGITAREAELVRLAVAQGAQAIEVVGRAEGLSVLFDRLPADAVENMVATLADGAPLGDLLRLAWPDGAVRMTDALVNGVALGWNPRKTARAMREGLQKGALGRCLTIARTEQMRVYRQASLAGYRASGVVRGYKRLAARSARTCLACLVEDGRFYALDEEFDAHPQCRCTLVPVLEGMPEREWEKGAAWLEKQPASVQKQVMGLARWELWKSGQVGLGEMVERHEHAVWGGSLGVKAVKSLPGGAEALQRVYDAAAKARAIEMVNKPKKAPHYGELQAARLAEVRGMTLEKWETLRQGMRQAQTLPKLNEHFRKHGKGFEDLGVTDAREMQGLFLEHIRRSDLEVFTYVATQKGTQYRQWILAGMDNGVVALYNESKGRYWSFWRPNDFEGYLQGGRGWWLRAEGLAGKVKVRQW